MSQLLSTVTTRVESFTSALETREPADLLRDARRFAARRPVAFLAAAAGVGLLAGRLTRGLGDSEDENEFDGRYRVPAEPGAYGPPSTTGTQGFAGSEPAERPVAEFGEFPDTSADPTHTGTLRGEGFAAPDPARDPFTGFEHPEERR